MNEIDYQKIFEVLDRVTGLPLKRRGRKWFGACYIDGSESPRWDKLSCRLVPEGIQLFEQGNGGTTLFSWMMQHGGCTTKAEAFKKLKEIGSSNIVIPPPRPEPPMRYIYPDILEREKRDIGILEDNLFLFLAENYGREKVIRAYELMNITPLLSKDGHIATTFWYVDGEGRVLHDKSIVYRSDGKRDKDLKAFTRFKVDYGYRGRCLFGEHLRKRMGDGLIYVVESEKTALLMYLEYGSRVLAAGGSNNLLGVRPEYRLLRDKDKAGDIWKEQYPDQCPDWWSSYSDVPIETGWDMGDVIMYKLNNRKNERIYRDRHMQEDCDGSDKVEQDA